MDVESAIVRTPDGGVALVPSGCYLEEGRCLGVAQELARLRAENAELKRAPVETPLGLVVALALGLVAGLGLGVAVAVTR